jgi:transcriptional regulator GlxA family with amidase domain
VKLRPELEDIVNTLRAAGADGLSLDELAEALGTMPVSYDEVDAMIAELEAGGVAVQSPPAVDLPAELRTVLAAARALDADLGRRPSAVEIAERAGLPVAAVRRALLYARVLSR